MLILQLLGRLPVHIENHNGNTPARYKQFETLERCFNNLKNNNIEVERFRADSAFYQKEVIEFYNQRGDAENTKKFLMSDFNLKRLPFMDFDTNIVFMYLMAMCNILFEWTKIILVKNKTQKINLKMRVKAVCFRYITVATTFVNHAKEKILHVFSDQEYKILPI